MEAAEGQVIHHSEQAGKSLQAFYGVDNPSAATAKLKQYSHFLTPLLAEPSDQYKGVLVGRIADLKAVPDLMQVSQVKAIVDFFEDDTKTIAEEVGEGAFGKVKVPAEVRTIRSDEAVIVDYMEKRGKLEDLLLEAGVIRKRAVEEPRSKLNFNEDDEFHLTDLKAGDRVTLVDYKGRELQIETPVNYETQSAGSIVGARGTDAQALRRMTGMNFALSVYHPVDERLLRAGIQFEKEDYVICVPQDPDRLRLKSRTTERYTERGAGRLVFQDGNGRAILNLRLARVNVEPGNSLERLRLEAIHNRINAANESIVSDLKFEGVDSIGRVKEKGYELKLEKTREGKIDYVRIHEAGSDTLEEYLIERDSAAKVTYTKAGNEWVAMPGVDKDGQTKYAEGGRTDVPLSEVAMVLEKASNLIPAK